MLSGNSLRQTVYTHRASVHQAAKLVASLLRVARVTAGLVERNGSLLPGLWLMSPAGWLPRTGISSRTLPLAVDYGLRLLSLLMNIIVDVTCLTSEIYTNFHRILCEKCDVHHKPLCSEIDDYQLVFMTWQNPYVCVCVCVCGRTQTWYWCTIWTCRWLTTVVCACHTSLCTALTAPTGHATPLSHSSDPCVSTGLLL